LPGLQIAPTQVSYHFQGEETFQLGGEECD
jgi:hypothetical protein